MPTYHATYHVSSEPNSDYQDGRNDGARDHREGKHYQWRFRTTNERYNRGYADGWNKAIREGRGQ